MAGILVVTQGELAEELARAAQRIAGVANRIETVSLAWNESPIESQDKVAEALAQLENGRGAEGGVLILTDLPGGTPFNIAKKFARPDKVEVVSGVNLSMLVRLCCPGGGERSLGNLAEWLQEKGRQSIVRFESGSSEDRPDRLAGETDRRRA